MLPNHALAITLAAAPQNMVMCTGNVAYRVYLQEAKPANDTHHVGCARCTAIQQVGRKPQPPRLAVVDGQLIGRMELARWHGKGTLYWSNDPIISQL